MNKQEQITQMAVLGCVRNPQAHTVEECAKCDFKQGMCNAYRNAEALYNAGYQKVPEDSVVLSREEYERLVNQYKILINELEEENERLREENYIIKSNPPIIAGRSVGKTIRAKLIDYDKLKQFNKSLKDRIAELENKTELNKSMEIQQALNKGKQETAKEILDELLKEENLENVYFTDENGDIRNRQVIRIEKIKDIVKKYSVEVEE